MFSLDYALEFPFHFLSVQDDIFKLFVLSNKQIKTQLYSIYSDIKWKKLQIFKETWTIECLAFGSWLN